MGHLGQLGQHRIQAFQTNGPTLSIGYCPGRARRLNRPGAGRAYVAEFEQFAQQWAAKAKSLGWTFDELFAFREPFANVSLQGAAWFVGDATVTAVTADAITLRADSGATQRAYRNSALRDDLVDAAIAFLKAELTDGAWRNSFGVEDRADAIGITIENLARARHKLGAEFETVARHAP